MFPPRSNTSSVLNSSVATLTKASRESVFSDTSDVLFSSHAHRTNGASRPNRSDAPLINAFRESVFSDTSDVLSSSHNAHKTKGSSRASASAHNVVPKANGQTNTLIPYVTQPVNRRVSHSYRPHRDSVHFEIPPAQISQSPAQSAGDFLSPTYLTPYVSANPQLNIHPSRRTSVSYRNPSLACQHDYKKHNAVQTTLDILEGRSRRRQSSSRASGREDEKPSGLVGPSKDEGHPIHPPVYPHTVAPESTYDYDDPDGLWEVDGPVVLKRQERTRTIKAQYVPEVVRIDEAYEEESVGSPDSVFYARLPERTRDGDSPHPNATHFFPPTRGQMQTCEGYKCKVRRYDKKKNRHSDWCEGVIQHAYIFEPVNGKDVSYYKVAFENPILGPQSEFFFAERNEFTFNMRG